MYGRTLEQDIVSDTSGHFKRLMVSLANVSGSSLVVWVDLLNYIHSSLR